MWQYWIIQLQLIQNHIANKENKMEILNKMDLATEARLHCEKKYWAKGVMLQAESMLIKWAFDELGLHKIRAVARTDNIASIVTMKKMGFQIEGTLRQEKCIAGKHIDVFRVGLLKDEFKNYSFIKEI